MKLSRFGRISMALAVSVAVGLGMTACGGGTVGFMWVLGTQFNQIAGFKIDDYTGNLTNTVGSPYPSNGTNPVSIVVRVGGRFIYVINKGTTLGTGNISLFSVGGDGNLTFQATYFSSGNSPVWATMDSGGNFLYVLDQLDPTNAPGGSAPTGNGDVTVFSSDPNTGRLALVQNQQILTSTGQATSYFPVGKNPIMVNLASSCLYSLNQGDSSVTPYSVGSGGQLTKPTNTNLQIGLNPEGNARNLTSINTSSSYTIITDATPIVGNSTIPASPGGQILQYTTGSNCALNTAVGSPTNNLPLTSNPVNSFIDTRNQYLYVLNRSTTNTTNTNSTISAFILPSASNTTLTPVNDPTNPFPVGSAPMCMVEDPTSQYLYTSNNVDGTVTGKFLKQSTGQLSQLSRGSTFTATGLATCLAVSGNVQ